MQIVEETRVCLLNRAYIFQVQSLSVFYNSTSYLWECSCASLGPVSNNLRTHCPDRRALTRGWWYTRRFVDSLRRIPRRTIRLARWRAIWRTRGHDSRKSGHLGHSQCHEDTLRTASPGASRDIKSDVSRQFEPP